MAVNPDLTYAVVEVASGQPFKYLIIAKDLKERMAQVLGTELSVQAEMKGADLEHSTYRHPLFDRESPILIGGDYVTTGIGYWSGAYCPRSR